MGNKIKDLTGQKFGKLTVIEYLGIFNHKARFECICECGNTKVVTGVHLRNGHVRSCGCLAKNNMNQTTHGLSNHPLYNVWQGIKARCNCNTDKHYKFYGGRGISICDEWKNDFKAFYDWSMSHGYQKGVMLDRIDNDLGYSPDNCRWVNSKIQNNNRRNNILIRFNGKTQTLAQWSDEINIKMTTLYNRLNALGWSIEKTLTTPVKKKEVI